METFKIVSTCFKVKTFVSGFIIEQRKLKKFKNINVKIVTFTFLTNDHTLAKNINQFYSNLPSKKKLKDRVST